MAQAVETRRLEVHPDTVERVKEELLSRVRLRFSFEPAGWWQLWRFPAFTITGPASAIDAAVEAIDLIEAEHRGERAW